MLPIVRLNVVDDEGDHAPSHVLLFVESMHTS